MHIRTNAPSGLADEMPDVRVRGVADVIPELI